MGEREKRMPAINSTVQRKKSRLVELSLFILTRMRGGVCVCLCV